MTRHRKPDAGSWMLMILVALSAACSGGKPAFLERTIEIDGAEARYRVFVPAGYTSDRAWPVILFLHGAGERGTDNALQTEVGLGPALRRDPKRFPALVVFPQVPPGETWHGKSLRVAREAVRRTVNELNGDPTRVYLVGLSMGGFGAWELAFDEPDTFAAIVTVCGGLAAPPPWDILDLEIDAEDPYAVIARRLRGVPVWLFHGAEDRTIPTAESRRLHEAFSRLGSPVRYTEYPGLGHKVWEEAFAEADLWPWLFQQRRRRGFGMGNGTWPMGHGPWAMGHGPWEIENGSVAE